MITISLKEIKAHEPCKDGWKKLKKAKKGIDKNDQFPMSDLLETNDLNDCFWALRCKPEHNNLWRKYAVWSARQVQHLMTDERSLKALDVAWAHSEGLATDEELAAARDAAWAAALAAKAAALAAGSAARDAAWDASLAAWAAEAAVRSAARSAVLAASGSAARAARDAAGFAAWAAATAGAGVEQEKKLKQILDAGVWIYD